MSQIAFKKKVYITFVDLRLADKTVDFSFFFPPLAIIPRFLHPASVCTHGHRVII
jgi:hypothetical protein